MTRTRRIYNNPRLKKTVRWDLSGDRGQALHGLVFHPYLSGLCMGNCPHCRDPNKDQKHQRKIRKVEFRRILLQESS